MTVFITGGSGSGKSAFAESIAQKLGGSLVYVATMPVASDEDKAKVERHHRLRAGKGFVTLERPGKLADLPDGGETMLIECISTHTANLMFGPGDARRPTTDTTHPTTDIAFWTETLKKELEPILKRKGNTIFVSAEIASDGATYSPETEAYKSVLTAINRHLVQSCDAAFELVCGIPVKIKGELPC
jgi:adenosylcobinamide kinase/adenosylcobinamide-phosphate guanylyltransferase